MEASAGDEELESLLRNLHRVSQVRKAAARAAPLPAAQFPPRSPRCESC
jgi:hypothetical protein